MFGHLEGSGVRLGLDLGAILGIPNRQNRSCNLLKIRAPIWSDIFDHLGAPGVVLGSMLGPFGGRFRVPGRVTQN